MSESLKQRRRKLLDKLDSKLQEKVNLAQETFGETGGKIASGVAAGVSATADFFTPESPSDAALALIPGGALAKAAAKIKRLKKAKKARKADTEDPGFGDDISIKDIAKKRKEKEVEKPFVDDEDFRLGYYRNKTKG